MAKLMVVAGDDTNQLVKYLQGKTTMEVDFHYPNLVSYQRELDSTFVQVDKLVYIQAKEPRVFREDLYVLRSLLTGKGFFVVRELIFFTLEDRENTSQIESFMKVVATDIATSNSRVVIPPYQEYVFREGDLSFERIYDGILGEVEASNADNGAETVFIVERGETANNSYEPEEDETSIYEPFSYKELKAHERLKQEFATRSIGNEVREEELRSLVKNNPVFGRLRVPTIDKKVCALVSGTPKSGSTVISVGIAVSLSAKVDKVLLLDLTRTSGAKYMMTAQKVPHLVESVSTLISGDIVKFNQGVTLVSGCPSFVKLQLIRHLSTNFHRLECNAVIINADGPDLVEVASLLSNLLSKCLYTCMPVSSDITLAEEHLIGINNPDIVTYESPATDLSPLPMSKDSIRERIPWVSGIWSPIILRNFALDGEMSEHMLGV